MMGRLLLLVPRGTTLYYSRRRRTRTRRGRCRMRRREMMRGGRGRVRGCRGFEQNEVLLGSSYARTAAPLAVKTSRSRATWTRWYATPQFQSVRPADTATLPHTFRLGYRLEPWTQQSLYRPTQIHFLVSIPPAFNWSNNTGVLEGHLHHGLSCIKRMKRFRREFGGHGAFVQVAALVLSARQEFLMRHRLVP